MWISRRRSRPGSSHNSVHSATVYCTGYFDDGTNGDGCSDSKHGSNVDADADNNSDCCSINDADSDDG
ncbi:MAG: hypothetical protein NVS4B8_19920 [Herpetosiphon sp.]